MALVDTCDSVVVMDHCSQVLNLVAVGMVLSVNRLVVVDSLVADNQAVDILIVVDS